MEFSCVVRELKTKREVSVKFPCKMEFLREKLGLPENVPFEVYICDSTLPISVSENISIDDLNKFAKMVENVDTDLVEAVQEVTGYSVSDFVEYNIDFNNCVFYNGVSTDKELGETYVDEVFGGISNLDQQTLENHFDYDSYGRSVRIAGNGGFSKKGFIEVVE